MELSVRVVLLAALMAALVAAPGEAIFTSRCMWKDVVRQLQQMHDSGAGSSSSSSSSAASDSAEHWGWGWGSRVRRFLWSDGDACEWLCDKDDSLPGLPGLPTVEELCSRCCPGKTSPTPRPASTTSRQTTPAGSASTEAATEAKTEAVTEAATGSSSTTAVTATSTAGASAGGRAGPAVVRREVRSTPPAPLAPLGQQMVGHIACHAPEQLLPDGGRPQARTFLGLPLPGLLPQMLISLSCSDCSGIAASTAPAPSQHFLTFCRACCPADTETLPGPANSP